MNRAALAAAASVDGNATLAPVVVDDSAGAPSELAYALGFVKRALSALPLLTRRRPPPVLLPAEAAATAEVAALDAGLRTIDEARDGESDRNADEDEDDEAVDGKSKDEDEDEDAADAAA